METRKTHRKAREEIKMDAKGRVYADFAKMRARIELMKDGKRKAKAMHLWYILRECVCNNTPNQRQLDHEDRTGVYHKP